MMNDINNDLKRLLLLNGSFTENDMSAIVEYAKKASESDYLSLIEILKDCTVSYLNCQIDNDRKESKILNLAQLKSHLLDWEKLFGLPFLKDVLFLIQRTSLPVLDVIESRYISPSGIKDAVDDYVIGQDEYLDKLSLVFYTHYLRILVHRNYRNIPRANLLVYGPTGVGKTSAVEILAEIFQLNVEIINCNSLVQEGIVGRSITDAFTNIYIKNNKDILLVEKSIIFFDEFDKLLKPGYYNSRIIDEILNIIDDNGYVNFKDNFNNHEYENIRASTKNMMFIFSGVFEGLKEVVRKKRNLSSIGYVREEIAQENDLYEYVEPEDFNKLNIPMEILGRINDFTYVKELSAEAIEDIIMRSEQSPIIPFKNYFKSHNVTLELDEEGVEELSQYIVEKKFGARGIKSLLWKVLADEMEEAGDKIGKNKTVLINKKFVEMKLKKNKKKKNGI
ncbi:MAG TPA: AAA domain-containing protein [Bacteroidales bacterium]|nr:AAA domain-containing protein [Bacteroidales bacterium]